MPAGDDIVFLIGERERFMLDGRLHTLVAPLIDGRRTEGQIIESLAHEASAPEVYYSLFTLEEQGYVAEVRPEMAEEQASSGMNSVSMPPARRSSWQLQPWPCTPCPDSMPRR